MHFHRYIFVPERGDFPASIYVDQLRRSTRLKGQCVDYSFVPGRVLDVNAADWRETKNSRTQEHNYDRNANLHCIHSCFWACELHPNAVALLHGEPMC